MIEEGPGGKRAPPLLGAVLVFLFLEILLSGKTFIDLY